MTIGANIRARRRALGINQEELARRLDTTQANISRMESSARGPSAEMLIPMAEALSCDVRDLLGVTQREAEGGVAPLDEGAQEFLMRTLASDPQLGVYMRSFVRDQDSLTEEDWKFLASSLRLALGYAVDTIKTRRVKEGF